ncbi:hypothetical protein L1887_51064 [Cichorium endivia]|nr:hypothetical protein L1887_51064 [Cichorium endivia]
MFHNLPACARVAIQSHTISNISKKENIKRQPKKTGKFNSRMLDRLDAILRGRLLESWTAVQSCRPYHFVLLASGRTAIASTRIPALGCTVDPTRCILCQAVQIRTRYLCSSYVYRA